MRNKLLLSLLSILFTITFSTVRAQENSGTATVVAMQDWFPPATTFAAGTLGVTGSGVAVCTGMDDDDVWYRFTATTQAAKITIQNPVFNAVIELYNSGIGFVACENTNAGNTTEIMRVNGLTIGQQYYVRVHSFDGVGGAGTFQYAFEFFPLAEVRNGWYPIYTPDDANAGYKVNQTVNRSNYGAVNNPLIQATRWLFIDTSNGQQCTVDINGTNAQVSLDNLALSCICYNKIYDVYVQVKVENYWCGFATVRQIDMEDYATTYLEPAYNAQYYNLDDVNANIKALYVGNQQVIEWELTTDNGQTTLDYISSSSYLYFQDVSCIRYNKIYNVRVRCSYCGGPWGPWSAFGYIIMLPLPYTNLEPQFCNTTQFTGGTLLCDFVNVADSYAWQFAPIEAGDPDMVPIGPAIVAYSNCNDGTECTDLFLLNVGLEYGQTYRVGVKPFVGKFDACDDIQEGDYGYFCPITIFDPFGFTGDGGNDMVLNEQDPTEADFEQPVRLFTNLNSNRMVALKVDNQPVAGNGILKVYGLNGALVYEQVVTDVQQAGYIPVALPGNLTTGLYVISLQTEGGNITSKIFVQ